MQTQTTTFTYNNQPIVFEVTSPSALLINASQMALPFGRYARHFLATPQAREFIKALGGIIVKYPKSPLVKIVQHHNTPKILDNRGENGIYMHRLLALKFAAWLNPAFELWMHQTIDELLFGPYIAWVAQYPELGDFFNLEAKLISNANKASKN